MFVNTLVTFTHIFTHTRTHTHTTGRFLKDLRKNFQDKLAHANSTAEVLLRVQNDAFVWCEY